MRLANMEEVVIKAEMAALSAAAESEQLVSALVDRTAALLAGEPRRGL